MGPAKDHRSAATTPRPAADVVAASAPPRPRPIAVRPHSRLVARTPRDAAPTKALPRQLFRIPARVLPRPEHHFQFPAVLARETLPPRRRCPTFPPETEAQLHAQLHGCRGTHQLRPSARSTKRRSPDDSFPPSLASWQPPRGSERNAERAKHPIPSDRRNTTRQTKHHDSGPRGAGTYRTGCEDEELTWIFAAPDRPRNLSGRRVFFCGCGDPCR